MVRLFSKSSHADFDEPVLIVSVYKINSLYFIPKFKSPLAIATKNFSYSSGGSSSINGFDGSGSGCANKQGITVMDKDSNYLVYSHTGNDLRGNPPKKPVLHFSTGLPTS